MNNDLLIKIAEGIIFTSQEPIKVKDISNRYLNVRILIL